MAKIDIESAYRLIPVHPTDRPLQAMEWNGQIYIDPMLPFGLRSAPKLFNAVADALEWYLRQRGIQHVFHYLDDFIVVARPATPDCAEAVGTIDETCARLGIPIAEHKRDGPTTCLTFLGIEIDTIAAQLRLPADKLGCLQTTLSNWGNRKACLRRELESKIGLLNHACKVVWAGRSFLRRMLDLLHTLPMHPLKPHPVRLNREFRSDLAWWGIFVEQWNGISFLTPPAHLPILQLASDASGTWGCGALHGSGWFQVQWDQQAAALQIMEKELIPIVLACAVWGPQWHKHRVRCLCDNQAVVAALYSRTCRNSHCMHLLRALAFVEAQHAFHLQPEYIDTRANHLADDLSRDNLLSFFSKVPWMDRRPTPLPASLLTLLLDPTQDWTSPLWLRQFSSIYRAVWHHLHGDHTTRR